MPCTQQERRLKIAIVNCRCNTYNSLRSLTYLRYATMSSVYALVFCSMFLQSDGTVSQPSGRMPLVQPTPFVATPPAGLPIQTAPIVEPGIVPSATNARQARFTNGRSELAKHSHVVLSATEGAVLLSLATERRDAAGNIVRDSDGNPIIVPITEGMNVFQGQVLGKFDDRELHSILQINQAQLEVAKAERDKKLEILVAAHGVRLAYAELQRLHDGNRQMANVQMANVFPEQEVQRAELACVHAEANLELQKYNIDEVKTREVVVRESDLDRTKVQIGLRQLEATIDGMIVKINAAEGEYLREGQEVLEIMRLDTLRVRVLASVKEYVVSDFDSKQAVVQLALPNGRTEAFRGSVVFCDPNVDSADWFAVYVEVQNRRVGNFWLLQPGRNGLEVVIQL